MFKVERLSGGDGTPIVSVDFQQFTTGSSAGEIFSRASGDHQVFRVDPVADLATAAGLIPTLPEMAEAYAVSLQEYSLGPQVTVVGYCSAAALSLQLAESLRQASLRVTSILIQPTLPTDASISADFARFRSELGETTPADSLSGMRAQAAADAARKVLADDLTGFLTRQRLDLDVGRALYQELITRCQAWLGFLVSTQAALAQPWRHGLRPRILLDATSAAYLPWPTGHQYEVIRLRVTEQELLSEAVLPSIVFEQALPRKMAETRPALLDDDLRLAVISDIDDIPVADFESLDTTAGAAGCYHRVRQWQADGRWQVRYISAVADGRFVVGMPIVNSRGQNWPDPRYHPDHWGMTSEPLAAQQIMLVGGCADLRSNLQISDEERWRALPGEAVRYIARLAAAEGRCLVFPYMSGPAVKRLTDASGGLISWKLVAREAHFDDVLEPDYESKRGSRVRGVWRRDRKLLARTGLHTWVTAWPEAAAEAAGLIATHNSRKGQVDHTEFVRMRHDQWNNCEQVELIVFGAECIGVRGMMTAFIWRDELELYEIGLTGEEGPHRLATYISLLFHQPLALARERGLRKIRAGIGAETPKSSRGAVFADLHAGMLDVQRTRMLAMWRDL